MKSWRSWRRRGSETKVGEQARGEGERQRERESVEHEMFRANGC